ncbi:hypothetical protein OHB26_16375 [Nocardia sp. NBC_01503]|uniref:DUF7257 domain-containing protein n=1 Tax=Nocardia sp. NBC_01503 TaxID=2975997 RepID=UPI002E7AE1E9|nr:hypothetical protein [Nocardia sp. NBC_01503]WTL35627.1 hypothetical protein OHB26_16375 [Nocardia sp. NBC_01503]
MTSPDKHVPSGAYGGSSSSGNNIANLQAVTWAGARDAVVANVMGSFSDVNMANAGLMGNAHNALGAANSAAEIAGNAQQTAVDVQTTTASNASVVASMTASQEGLNYGGTVFTDIFDRQSLQPGYSTFTTGQVANLVITNKQCGLSSTGNQGSGNVIALAATVTQTDDQAVSVVMGSGGGQGSPETFLIARAAADLRTFACAKVAAGRITLGYGTRKDMSSAIVETRSAAAQVNTGDTVLLEAIGPTYTLFVNGLEILQWNDAEQLTPVAAANRSFGFGISYSAGWFGRNYSFNAAGLTAVDMKAPPTVGTGWSLQMAAQSSVAAPAVNVPTVFPAGTFSGLVTSNNVTVLDQGSGRIQIQKAGWYGVTVRFQLDRGISSFRTYVCMASGAGVALTAARKGPLTSQAYATNTSATFVLYLQAGSVVAPGYFLPSGANIVGPATYFDGALLSY